MLDFGAILRKARERAKNAGAGGAGGATNEKPLQFKDNREPHPGPTVETMLGPVGPAPVHGPTGPTADYKVGPVRPTENSVRPQCVSNTGPTGPTGPTEKHDFRRNVDVEAFRVAALRNSPALFEPQADPNRCHICGERETADAPFIAVLTAKPGARHWLHADCHPEHVRRLDARAEAALADDEPAPF